MAAGRGAVAGPRRAAGAGAGAGGAREGERGMAGARQRLFGRDRRGGAAAPVPRRHPERFRDGAIGAKSSRKAGDGAADGGAVRSGRGPPSGEDGERNTVDDSRAFRRREADAAAAGGYAPAGAAPEAAGGGRGGASVAAASGGPPPPPDAGATAGGAPSGEGGATDAPSAAPADPARGGRPLPVPLGTTLRERYELVSVLGRGGMSTVYGAVDRFRLRAGSPQPLVALKILNADPAIGEDMVALLHREARRMQEFVHPNIVRVYDWDQDGAVCFIIMERLVGRTLAALLKERAGEPLPARPRAEIVRGVGAALAHAHAAGVVHADLKPGNVFLTTEGGVKLLDFGFSHRHDPELMSDSDEPTVVFFNRVGALTPAYAAIDLLYGRPAMPSDDIYSLGVIAYMMAAGRHPFDQKSARAACKEGLKAERPKGLSRSRWRALQAALAFPRQERPDTVEAFVDAFTRPTLMERLLR